VQCTQADKQIRLIVRVQLLGGFLKSEKAAQSTIIPLQVKAEHRATLLRHPAYKKRDIVDLFVEARNYVQGRLPVTDRAVAIAVLLSRDKR
jgi:hypothetical protein